MKVNEGNEVKVFKTHIGWGMIHYLQRNDKKKAGELMFQKEIINGRINSTLSLNLLENTSDSKV